jgi:IS6 family transposase
MLCVRWYLRYSLSYRDLEEIMEERGLLVNHVTIWRWVLRYAPILNQRIRRKVRHPNRSWRVDETYVRIAGKWSYLYRAVDSTGDTIDFVLSPNRDLDRSQTIPAARPVGRERRPAMGDQCGRPPSLCPSHLRMKQSGDLSRRCRCRPSPYLNNIIEIVFTQMTKPNLFAVRMGRDYVTDLDFALCHKDPVN